jgi:hypothetical protein
MTMKDLSDAQKELRDELHRRLDSWFTTEVPDIGNIEDGEGCQRFEVEIVGVGYDDNDNRLVSATVKTTHEDLLV